MCKKKLQFGGKGEHSLHDVWLTYNYKILNLY